MAAMALDVDYRAVFLVGLGSFFAVEQYLRPGQASHRPIEPVVLC